jgi:hypothetical protein
VQLYEKMLQLTQALAPEAMGPVASAMVKSAYKFMDDALASFEVSNASELLEGIALLQKVLPDARDLGGMESFARDAQQSEIIDQLRRVESMVNEAEGARGGREGLLGSGRLERNVEGAQGLPSRNPPSPILGGESYYRS